MRRITILLSVVCVAACSDSGSESAAPAPVASNATPISNVQGSGSSSPLAGQVVTVSGIVTGDFQDNDADISNNLGGFYLQQEAPDADPTTSEGIFVFDGNNPSTDVNVGDRVNVTGTVNEYFGETQITTSTVDVVGSGTIPSTDIELPASGAIANGDGDLIADLERYEGMLVRFPQMLTVTNLRNLEQYGAVGLSQGGRLYQFTNANSPDSAGYSAHKESNARRSIELDDGRRGANPTNIKYLTAGASAGYSIRTGDAITGITGTLRYSRGSGGNGDETWRLMPTAEQHFEPMNARPGAPMVAGNVRFASFNVLNFFSTVDSGRNVCGPQSDDSCRGADTDEELGRQLAKTVSALAIMDADIVGLIELENNDSDSLSMIVDALNAKIGSNDYAFLSTGTIHDDAIKVGLIYKTSTIRLAGPFALLDRGVDSRFNDARNRPALAQSFEVRSNGGVLTVIVNHLKSKGSSCEADGDPNLDDGQGNCNQTRSNAAAAMADWLATDPTGSNDPDYLIVGDLNAYAHEDPLAALKNGGFISLLEGPVDPYSFVFDAQAGALDHALASSSLASQVVAAIEWHINADEPALLDYNLEHGRDPALFDPDLPYRASDHDPVIVGLELTN